MEARLLALLGPGYEKGSVRGRPSTDGLPVDARAYLRESFLAMSPEAVMAARAVPGHWDIAGPDGLVIEFDEVQHFNRFRALSFAAPWTAALPWRTSYLRWCELYENVNLKEHRPGFWHGSRRNRAGISYAERLFGSSELGDLVTGSPRWKQRAWYDLIRDLQPFVRPNLRLARISEFDLVDGHLLGAVLRGRASADRESLQELIASRTIAQ